MTDNPVDGDQEIHENSDSDQNDGDDDGQINCPPGFHWDSESESCRPGVSCPPGFSWDADSGHCQPGAQADGDIITDGDEDLDTIEDTEQEEEIDPDPEIVIPPNPFNCKDEGYTSRDFIDAEDNRSLYAVAADFTVQTTKGDWNFRENWTGCETYLFIPDNPRQAQGWPNALWSRDVQTLLRDLPKNTQVFFVSTEISEAKRMASLEMVQNEVDKFLEDHGQDFVNRWWHRIHFVTNRATLIEGWLGANMQSPRWGMGIDRFQRLRYIGSFADYRRYDAGQSWFAPNLSMAANEAVYYNFEADRDARLQSQNATVIPVFEGEEISDTGWAGVKGYADIELPDAETMAGFDSMEFDLYLGCVGAGEYGTCPAWDYLVYLYLCDDPEDPDTCNTEIGRWITTYHREGRWVHDVSALLPYFAEGGAKRLAFHTVQPYEVSLSIRLFNSEKASRPSETIHLFKGSAFGPDYNAGYEPVVVPIPEDATKVELATVISGHGGASPGNCAEFCNTTHHFLVNEYETVISFPEAGTSEDCMSKTSIGTVPNQYGTWWYGRSGWCPGLEVPIKMTDITEHVLPGTDAAISYSGFYNREPYPSGGASIRMDAWLVISRAAR